MAYTKTNWQDRVVEFASRYKDQNQVVYTFTPDTGAVIVAGTPVIATNLNKIEQGIFDLDTTRALKSTTSNATLLSANWVGSSAPYTYTLNVTGVTTTNVVEILPQSGLTVAQSKEMSKASISTGTQSAGNIVLKAFGNKPTVDLPITIIVRGDI